MDTELIRLRFRPDVVKLLFVGESPPAGGKFFYVKSPMTAFTARAFEAAHGKQFPTDDQQEFLKYFKSCGCYLDDICHTPVDDLPKDQREKTVAASVAGFADRLATLNPAVIVVEVKRIDAPTRVAARQAGVDAPIHVLPFPGHGHQNRYMKALEGILREYLPVGP